MLNEEMPWWMPLVGGVLTLIAMFSVLLSIAGAVLFLR